MNSDPVTITSFQGLASKDIVTLQIQYGKNIFHAGPTRRFIHVVWDIVKEPMFILLLMACSLYFLLGETSEGLLMLVAMAIVAAIALYQDVKSSNALRTLQQFTLGKVTVIRDSIETLITIEELVPGDILLLEEGMNIPADAIILQQNDFSVNEAIITGESLPAVKEAIEGENILYQGTTINTGKCIARVTATGNQTVLGKLGRSVESLASPKTLLQVQVNRFVRMFALFGLLAFAMIFIMNYLHYQEWTTALLFALTLAMSAVPEEIPVAFSSFMALGAYKMSKLGIISRQSLVVENLGAVSMFCFDKTGTITENKMELKSIYVHSSGQLLELPAKPGTDVETVLYYGWLASESEPFDTMEKAIRDAWRSAGGYGMHEPMVYEYPLEGKPPMMTHVFGKGLIKTVAAKGATERILHVCHPDADARIKIESHIDTLASKGYRVIAVASATYDGIDMPVNQDDFHWQFQGLLAFYDPPRKNVVGILQQFYEAGIKVALITGDHGGTAMNIARQVGLRQDGNPISGDEVMNMEKDELKRVVKNNYVFARMFPDAKLKVIQALKANGEIVAMTGDGVNDGPALKASDIGIAMGKKGTEIARQAADLVLTDDDLSKLVTAVREGRKIFANLKKAIRYIISIHIPIILVSSLPLLMGWAYPNIFTPIHIIFLELIMGPTCSVFFEREPVEKNLLQQPPRERTAGIFTRKEILVSILQGLIIAIGVLLLYFYYMSKESGLEVTRTIVFTTLILSNVLLTFVNRSFTKTILQTSRYKNNLAPMVLAASGIFLAALHYIPAVRNLFYLAPIGLFEFGICAAAAFLCVMWIELFKIKMPVRSA
jgi:P-type Ca2+ transporter type 2C